MNAALVPQGEPVVSVKDGTAFASSRDVAAHFGKRHDDVLRRIRALLKQEPSLGLRTFAEGSYTLPETGSQKHAAFDMNRDGFALLAMGFTGAKALRFKLAWIDAFNRMEAEILALRIASSEPATTRSKKRLPRSGFPTPATFDIDRENLAVMRVAGETLVVDLGQLDLGPNDRAVCFDAAGELLVESVTLSWPHRNWDGRRAANLRNGPAGPLGDRQHRGVWVIGRVLQVLPNPEAVGRTTEAAPKRIGRTPKRHAGRFEPGSDIAKDLLLVVRSARHRMGRDKALDLGRALAETLEDLIARADDPLAKTRGVVLDWDQDRATEDLHGKMRAGGEDPGSCRAREVMH